MVLLRGGGGSQSGDNIFGPLFSGFYCAFFFLLYKPYPIELGALMTFALVKTMLFIQSQKKNGNIL